MQGERSYLDPFPETMNLNQGSDSNTSAMERSATRDNLLNPVESRLSNYALSSSEGNNNLQNPHSGNTGSFSGWHPGESSSGANSQNRLVGRELKIEHGWPSSLNMYMVADTSAVDWRYEPPNVPGYDSNSSGHGGPCMQGPLNMNASSTLDPVSVNRSHGYTNPTGESSETAGKAASPHIYQPGGSETQHFPTEYSGQNDNGFTSSSSPWGSSCKRKALEGCSRQSPSVGYSSHNSQDEDMWWHSISAPFNASSSSSSQNPRDGVGIGRAVSEGYPPASFAEVLERSQRNFGIEACGVQQEAVPSDLSVPGTDIRHATPRSAEHPSGPVLTTEHSGLAQTFSGPTPLNHPQSQCHLVQVPGSGRSTVPYTRGEFLGSPGTLSSDPLSSQVEAAVRSFLSTREHSLFGSPSEARHILQEPPNWSFVPANSGSYRNIPSSSRADPPSSSRSVPPVWITHQNAAAHTQPRFPEQSTWTRFPPVELAPGGQRGQFLHFPSGPSSPVEAVSGSSTGVHLNRSRHRSFWRDASADDINGWHALAAGGGGRDRLVSEIRNVLNAMQRAENIGSEDYMMLDPFLSGIADLHDGHRDMRLDVDNMSYEELLALEEHIGNVNTGLSEDAVMQLMKQRKYKFITRESGSNPEPCCVCQEDYVVGEDTGELDCGHEFHTNCIKQWLMLKNLCPICKMTGLLP